MSQPAALQSTASGTHTRVQMQRDGQSLIPHGTLSTYDPVTGGFTAFMDFQAVGESAYAFTPVANNPGTFTDQNGLVWSMVR